jgi:hypothetical protein
MFARILTFGVDHRLITLTFIAVISAIALNGVLGLQIDTSYDSLISERDPGKAGYDETVSRFGSDNTTVITVRDPKLFDPGMLAMLSDLVVDIETLKEVERVDSLFSAVNIRDRGGVLSSGPLMDIPPETLEEAVEIRANAIYSPLIRGNLLSADATTTAINVTVVRDRANPRFNHEVYAAIDKLLVPLRSTFQDIRQVGPPRLNVEIEKGMFADLKLLTPLSIAVLVVAIILLMRVPLAALIPMITAGLSILFTLGFMGYVGLKLTLLTAIVPSLLIVIGSTEDMHLIALYLEGLSEGREGDRKAAMRVAARYAGIAIFLTAVTTAVGFASNAANDIPLIRDFAIASAFGMVANFVITVLLTPLILSVAGPRHNPLHRDGASEARGVIGVIVPLIERVVSRYGRRVTILTAIVVAVFAVLSTRVHVSNDPLSYFPSDHPLVVDADFLHDNLSGMQIFYLTLDGGQPAAFRDPENLARIEGAVARLNAGGQFDKVLAISNYLALVNREMHGGDAGFMKTPGTRNLVDQYLLLFQRSDIDRYLSADARYANIIVRHNVSDSHALNGYLADLEQALPAILGSGIRYDLTGENLMINRAAEGLFVGQVQSLLLIGGLVFVLMSLLFTSPFAGAMFLIPNLVPLVMNFGAMALLGIPLNPGTASVAAIALGLAVDDTIHLFTRFREEIRRHGDPDEAVRVTLRGEAVAVVTTSLALMAMYGTLLASNFAIVEQFGLLAALTMLFALFGDLIITPLVLKKVGLVGVFEIATLRLARPVIAVSPLFSGMTPYQIKKCVLLSKMAAFGPAQTIFEQGAMGNSLYLILKGEVEVFLEQPDGKRMINRLGPGQTFGEIAFVNAGRRSATVVAGSHVETMVLSPENTRKALRFHPRIASQLYLNIGRILGDLVVTATERGGADVSQRPVAE